jgi:cell division protein ZapA (FtsZ GTPase activity inhibitor)
LHAKATAGEWVIWGLKSRHGHLTIGIEKETGPAKHICKMAWLRDLREQGASGGDDAAAIVAAMNSLDALLECAEALHEIATWDATTDSWYRHHQMVQAKARAALQALAEGGGE